MKEGEEDGLGQIFETHLNARTNIQKRDDHLDPGAGIWISRKGFREFDHGFYPIFLPKDFKPPSGHPHAEVKVFVAFGLICLRIPDSNPIVFNDYLQRFFIQRRKPDSNQSSGFKR